MYLVERRTEGVPLSEKTGPSRECYTVLGLCELCFFATLVGESKAVGYRNLALRAV
jgi:hypothetical protein